MDQLADCQKFKDEGNTFLKNNEFEKAIDSYSKALDLAKSDKSIADSKIAIYFANRSFANIKLQNYGVAIADAEESIKHNPDYEKAYLRLAFSNQILQHYKEAYGAYKRAFEISGNKDESIYQKLINCKKESEEHLKNKKMMLLHDQKERGPKTQKPYKNWREIEVEKEYTGLRLEQKQEIDSEWVKKLMNRYKAQQPLHKRYTLQLIEKCKDILSSYKTLVDYTIPDEQEITVCGDIHGQYYDLFNIFALNGYPSDNNKYLFNGDFVDRGSFSVQCIMTLIAWKCANKQYLHMTRGNHQAKQVNMVYGFKGEVQAKFKDPGVYEAFSELFCALPLAYVFNTKVMVCHGGLPSTDGILLKNIREIDRFIEPPERGVMCDLLWADPSPTSGRNVSKRGVSMTFGADISNKFLDENNLTLLIRSHEVKQEGYESTHNGRCITIFSAPNYCDFTGNEAAFIRLKGNEMKPKYTKFKAVDHPNIGPMAYASQFKGMF